MGWLATQREAAKKHVQFDAMFGDVSLVSGMVSLHSDPRFKKRSVSGATAAWEQGADAGSRTTLTRVAAGAIIAGPVGAIVGGMFKKDRTKVYVTIEWPDGAVIVGEGPAKDESKARTFVEKVKGAGQAY